MATPLNVSANNVSHALRVGLAHFYYAYFLLVVFLSYNLPAIS